MFTGIVEDVGTIVKKDRKGSNLTFQISTNLKDIGIDDSISCNGICLTVEQIHQNTLIFTAVDETLKKTNARKWETGDRINLERTLRFNGRIDGHIVQGHVDDTGICTSIEPADGSYVITTLYDKKFSQLLIEKGSICINGTSLTVFDLTEDTFKVTIIPYTWMHTNFQYLKENDRVNLEFDIFGKYIQRYLSLK